MANYFKQSLESATIVNGRMVAILFVALLTTGNARAATDITPTIAAGVLWEDNARFDREDEESETAFTLSGQVDLQWYTERTDVSLTPRGFFTFYDGSVNDQGISNNDLEDENFYVNFNVNHKFRRSAIGFNSSWRDISIRTSELDSATPDDPDAPPPAGGSTRTIIIDDSQELWTINPYWSYFISPKNRVSASVGYTDVSYDRTDRSTGRRPYEYNVGSLSYEYIFNERDSFSIRVNGSLFDARANNRRIFGEPPGAPQLTTSTTRNETTTYGATLVYSRRLSDTLTLSVTGGSSKSEFDIVEKPVAGFEGPPGAECLVAATALDLDGDGMTDIIANSLFSECININDDDSTFIGGLSLRKRGEDTLYNLDISRSISPNSNGVTVIGDVLRAFLDHSFNDRWRGSFGVVAYQQEDNGSLTPRARDYAQFEASVTRRFSRRWSARLRYNYTWADDDLVVDTGTGVVDAGLPSRDRNSILFQVSYKGLSRKF